MQLVEGHRQELAEYARYRLDAASDDFAMLKQRGDGEADDFAREILICAEVIGATGGSDDVSLSSEAFDWLDAERVGLPQWIADLKAEDSESGEFDESERAVALLAVLDGVSSQRGAI